MRIFAPEMVRGILQRLGLTDGEAMDHPMVTRGIERAQKKVEDRNFGIRKNLLEYDGVMAEQRKIIYRERQQILDGSDLKDVFQSKIDETVERLTATHMSDNMPIAERNYDEFLQQIKMKFNIDTKIEEVNGKSEQQIVGVLQRRISEVYSSKEQKISSDAMRELERFVMLQVIDQKWKDHLHAMDHLKEGIHLRAQAQKDPKIEYKKEGYELFTIMTNSIVDDMVSLILHVEISQREEEEILQRNEQPSKETVELHPGYEEESKSEKDIFKEAAEVKPIVNNEPKVGRNDACRVRWSVSGGLHRRSTGMVQAGGQRAVHCARRHRIRQADGGEGQHQGDALRNTARTAGGAAAGLGPGVDSTGLALPGAGQQTWSGPGAARSRGAAQAE